MKKTKKKKNELYNYLIKFMSPADEWIFLTKPTGHTVRTVSKLLLSQVTWPIATYTFRWRVAAMGCPNSNCIFKHNPHFKNRPDLIPLCKQLNTKHGCTRPNCTFRHTSLTTETAAAASNKVATQLAS